MLQTWQNNPNHQSQTAEEVGIHYSRGDDNENYPTIDLDATENWNTESKEYDLSTCPLDTTTDTTKKGNIYSEGGDLDSCSIPTSENWDTDANEGRINIIEVNAAQNKKPETEADVLDVTENWDVETINVHPDNSNLRLSGQKFVKIPVNSCDTTVERSCDIQNSQTNIMSNGDGSVITTNVNDSIHDTKMTSESNSENKQCEQSKNSKAKIHDQTDALFLSETKRKIIVNKFSLLNIIYSKTWVPFTNESKL